MCHFLMRVYILPYRAAFTAVVFAAVLFFLVYVNGLLISAYYTEKGCDPLSTGEISSSNQASMSSKLAMPIVVSSLSHLCIATYSVKI